MLACFRSSKKDSAVSPWWLTNAKVKVFSRDGKQMVKAWWTREKKIQIDGYELDDRGVWAKTSSSVTRTSRPLTHLFAEFSPDSRSCVVCWCDYLYGSSFSHIKIVDFVTNEHLDRGYCFIYGFRPKMVVWSPNNEHVAFVCTHRNKWYVKFASDPFAFVSNRRLDTFPNLYALSPDGTHLVVVDYHSKVTVFRKGTSATVVWVERFYWKVISVAWSASGNVLGLKLFQERDLVFIPVEREPILMHNQMGRPQLHQNFYFDLVATLESVDKVCVHVAFPWSFERHQFASRRQKETIFWLLCLARLPIELLLLMIPCAVNVPIQQLCVDVTGRYWMHHPTSTYLGERLPSIWNK